MFLCHCGALVQGVHQSKTHCTQCLTNIHNNNLDQSTLINIPPSTSTSVDPQAISSSYNNNEWCEKQEMNLVGVVGCVLNTLCASNEYGPLERLNTRFHGQIPKITIQDYIHRIEQYGECNSSCFVLSLIYIDRLILRNYSNITVSQYTIYRLLITTVMIACKFWSDYYFANSFYAKIGGLKTRELNELEIDFLMGCEFDLYVSIETYERYYQALFEHAIQHDGTCHSSHSPLSSQSSRFQSSFATQLSPSTLKNGSLLVHPVAQSVSQPVNNVVGQTVVISALQPANLISLESVD